MHVSHLSPSPSCSIITIETLITLKKYPSFHLTVRFLPVQLNENISQIQTSWTIFFFFISFLYYQFPLHHKPIWMSCIPKIVQIQLKSILFCWWKVGLMPINSNVVIFSMDGSFSHLSLVNWIWPFQVMSWINLENHFCLLVHVIVKD